MTITQEHKDIFTQGACGILAQEILDILPRGQAAIWYSDGEAIDAAVYYNAPSLTDLNYLIHLGDRCHGYVLVGRDELDRAVAEDFRDFDDDNETRNLARLIAAQMVGEIK